MKQRLQLANISKMMTDMAHLTIAIKFEVAYGLFIIIFKFDLGSF